MYGALKLKLYLLQEVKTVVVPFTANQDQGKGKGRAVPLLRQFITSPAQVNEFVEAWDTTQRTGNNGYNPLSSRWHSLVDGFTVTNGRQVLSLLDLCGDECSVVRAGPLQQESTRIAGDLEKLRTLVSKLKLAQRVSKVPAAKFKANKGRDSSLTRAVVHRLRSGVFDNLHVMLFGGNGAVQRIKRTCDMWKPVKLLDDSGKGQPDVAGKRKAVEAGDESRVGKRQRM